MILSLAVPLYQVLSAVTFQLMLMLHSPVVLHICFVEYCHLFCHLTIIGVNAPLIALIVLFSGDHCATPVVLTQISL